MFRGPKGDVGHNKLALPEYLKNTTLTGTTDYGDWSPRRVIPVLLFLVFYYLFTGKVDRSISDP